MVIQSEALLIGGSGLSRALPATLAHVGAALSLAVGVAVFMSPAATDTANTTEENSSRSSLVGSSSLDT